jgi:predicted P-loop ATPase
LPFKSLEDYEKCEMSRFRLQLPQSLSGHAGAWFAHDRQSLKKWVRKAAKAFDVDEEQVMEWCNETARVYQETSQQRIIRDLERHSELLLGKGDLRMDERTQEIYLGKKLLRPDSAVTSVRANLSLVPNRLLGEPTRDDVRDAIRHIAERDRFHPIREYLDGLKPWDGTRRMASAIDHLGVASAARHLLQEVLYKKFLISAVARCYEPGCKVDTMLILHGPQGVRKSSHFKALCADSSWFTDQGFDVNDKDAVLTIGRFWIVEWSELDNLRRSSRREALKGFLTRTVDSVRPPYGRAVIDLRRSCVFGGTTNDDTFLEDSTGLRRFWIISDVEDVDVEWFEKNRDYLWAEAISAYRAGEKWWLDSAQEQLLGELQHRHEVESQWAEVIEDYLTNGIRKKWDGTTEKAPTPESVTVRQVLEAIGKEQSRQTKADQREAADVLRSLGWVKDPSRTRANGRQIIWRKQGTTAVASLAGEGEWKSFLGVNPANCNGTPDLGSIDGTGQRLATVSSEATVEEIEPLPVCCRAGGA